MAEEKEPLRRWSSKAKKYRLVGRQHSGFSDDGTERVEFKTGDVVKLEPNEYEAFKDKFDVVKEVVKEEPVVEPVEDKASDPPKTEPLKTIPPVK